MAAGCSLCAPRELRGLPRLLFITSHRQNYSLNLQDLEKLQFFISTDVVARYQDATGTKSLLLPRMTPGVATGAGPNWIKVSFREEVPTFPLSPTRTSTMDGIGLPLKSKGPRISKKLSVSPSKLLFTKELGAMVSGSEAILLVDWEVSEESCRDTQS